jgi:hypothetical protein
MGRHNDSGRKHPRGKATVCRPCNENKDARAECWHWQVLAGFDPQWPNLKLRVAGFEMTVFGYFESGNFGSDTKTVRSFSALMICLVSGRRLLRTLLIMVRLVPVFFAHAVWPPARSTSERSKQMTSLSSRNFIYIHPPPLAA